MKVKEFLKNLLWKRFLTLYYLVFYPKIYSSIYDEGSAIVWDKIHENQDYSLLISKKTKIPITMLHTNKIVKAWENIYNEFIQEFPPESYYKDLAIRKKIALWRYKAEAHGERQYNTLAAIEESKLESKSKKKEKSNFAKNVVMIEKEINVKLDMLKLSIFEYNNYLRVLSA